ncbi:dockerin type I domain-containing protein [Roseimaritima sediminicola]|uniref:dockerin type I domain-containing protein n=1 Tax=Roseimaritima sediminicola TaxID=2662066 RepID=UPI0012984F27|nr:dockerin type I domain-containing protein [Roseimaritima sediminicola]
MLAADTSAEPPLQYTGGITVAGEIASPDINGDGYLDPLDALTMVNAINDGVDASLLPEADLNHDDNIDTADFAAVVDQLQQTPDDGTAAHVEPQWMLDDSMNPVDSMDPDGSMNPDDSCDGSDYRWIDLRAHDGGLGAEHEQPVDPDDALRLEQQGDDGNRVTEWKLVYGCRSENEELGPESELEEPGLEEPGLEEPGLEEPGLEEPGLEEPGSEVEPGSKVEPELGEPGLEPEPELGESGSEPEPELGEPGSEVEPGTEGMGPTTEPETPGGQLPGPTDPIAGPPEPQPEAPGEPGSPPTAEGPDLDWPDESELPADEQTLITTPAPPGPPGVENPPAAPAGPGEADPDVMGSDPPTAAPDVSPEVETSNEAEGATNFRLAEFKLLSENLSEESVEGEEVTVLREGDTLVIWGRVEGPRNGGLLQAPGPVIVTLDINYDGEITPNERTEVTMRGTLGDEFRVRYHIPDDGASPGDGQSSNTLAVSCIVAGEVTESSITIENIDPVWELPPTFELGRNEEGQTTATFDLFYGDIANDQHTLIVTWGGTQLPPVRLEPVEVPFHGGLMDAHHLFAYYRATQEVVLPEGLETNAPVTVRVQDDDRGSVQYVILHLDVVRNDNDDDRDGMPDLLDDIVERDGDLVELDLTQLMNAEMQEALEQHPGELQLHYPTNRLRLWASPDKRILVTPSYMTQDFSDDYRLSPLVEVVPYEGQSTLWVEGIAPGSASVRLDHDATTSEDPGHPAATHPWGGVANVMVWGVDADIDSDNNQGAKHSALNAGDLPSRSAWEEYLEGSNFAIGKMLYLGAQVYTPLVITLPDGLDVDDPNIKLKISRTRFESGKINLRCADGVLKNGSVAAEDRAGDGSVIFFRFEGDYNLDELGYSAGTGEIRLWIELQQLYEEHLTKEAVDENGKPDDRLQFQLIGVGPDKQFDDVKWMGVNRVSSDPSDRVKQTFYEFVHNNRHVRNALASGLVYEKEGKFGAAKESAPYLLKHVASTREDLKHLLERLARDVSDIDDEDVEYVLDQLFIREHKLSGKGSRTVPGLGVAFYLDHVSGEYTLAFRGTESDDETDWMENLSQVVGAFSNQYFGAIKMTYILHALKYFNGLNAAGHSLGGGLASAAALTNAIHADTFNAAGLRKETLQSYVERIDYVEGASDRFENQQGFVTAYAVNWQEEESGLMRSAPDVLTYLQDGIDFIAPSGRHYLPNAAGNRVRLRGLYQLGPLERMFASRLSAFLRDPDKVSVSVAVLAIMDLEKANAVVRLVGGDILDEEVTFFLGVRTLEKLIESHRMESVYYGLLENSGVDAYRDEVP